MNLGRGEPAAPHVHGVEEPPDPLPVGEAPDLTHDAELLAKGTGRHVRREGVEPAGQARGVCAGRRVPAVGVALDQQGMPKAEQSHDESVLHGSLTQAIALEAPGGGAQPSRKQEPAAPGGQVAVTQVLVFQKGQHFVKSAQAIEPVAGDEQSLIAIDRLGTAEGRQALVPVEGGKAGRARCGEAQLKVTGEPAVALRPPGRHGLGQLMVVVQPGVGVQKEQQGRLREGPPPVELDAPASRRLDHLGTVSSAQIPRPVPRASIRDNALDAQALLPREVVEETTDVGDLIERRDDDGQLGRRQTETPGRGTEALAARTPRGTALVRPARDYRGTARTRPPRAAFLLAGAGCPRGTAPGPTGSAKM